MLELEPNTPTRTFLSPLFPFFCITSFLCSYPNRACFAGPASGVRTEPRGGEVVHDDRGTDTQGRHCGGRVLGGATVLPEDRGEPFVACWSRLSPVCISSLHWSHVRPSLYFLATTHTFRFYRAQFFSSRFFVGRSLHMEILRCCHGKHKM